MLKTLLFAAAMTLAGNAYAEEVIIQHDAPVVEERAPSTSTTTVEKHGADCDSKSVHSENSEGDSKTVTRQDCD